MIDRNKAIETALRIAPVPGKFNTAIPGVSVFHRNTCNSESFYVTQPVIGFILQGRKQTVSGGITSIYGEDDFLVSCGTMPGSCTVLSNVEEKPFVGLSVDLDKQFLRSIFTEISPKDGETHEQVVFGAKMGDGLREAMFMLVEALGDEEKAAILGPLFVKQLHYYLAASELSGDLRRMCEVNTVSNRIIAVIEQMGQDLAGQINLEEAAASIGMSISTFHRKFKECTGMSPLQFQKRMRLHRAQEMMIVDGQRVTDSAYAVGYESVSQFVRDYSKVFGISPGKDVSEKRSKMAGCLPKLGK